MPIKRKYINTNPYKPTKRSDSHIKKSHFKIGANVSRKIGSIGTRDHFEIYYLKISSIVPVMSVEMHQEEKERERRVSEAFRRPPFFFPSGGERVRRTATLGLSIYHATHTGVVFTWPCSITYRAYIDKGKSSGERRLRQGVDRPEPLVEKYFPRGYFEHHRYKPSRPATQRWGDFKTIYVSRLNA